MRKIILFFVPILIVGCVSNSKYEKALNTIDSLKTENARLVILNEELENGETRLAGMYTLFVQQGKFIQAEDTYTNAISRHPQSSSNPAYNNIKSVRQKAQHQRDSIDKAVRDSLFLANIDDIGEWRIGDYVNDFREPTGEHYVYQYISGVFSNSATAGSRLGVKVRLYKSRYSSMKVDYTIDFDEYDNGTKDESDLSIAKAVCSDLRKVFFQPYRGSFYDIEEGDSSKKYSFLDLLMMENSFEVTDTHRRSEYYFIINSRKLSNALVKAGILSVDDVLNEQY